jgi:RNA polymerase sigma-70 factor, ECF subfamily
MATEDVVEVGFVDDATVPASDLATEAGLVRAMVHGSQEALASLYDRHNAKVFAAAMRTCGDRWMAAEIVQETFLAMWSRAEQFDPSRGTLSAWLGTIARNRAIDRLRAAGRHDRAATFSSFGRSDVDDHAVVEWLTATGELIGVAGPEPAPEIALADKETRASIEQGLRSLDPLERLVIVLAYDRGLTQSEIAASLGWPIGTVKTRTRRALRNLRDRIERPGVGVPADVTGRPRGTSEHSRPSQPKRTAGRFDGCLAPC